MGRALVGSTSNYLRISNPIDALDFSGDLARTVHMWHRPTQNFTNKWYAPLDKAINASGQWCFGLYLSSGHPGANAGGGSMGLWTGGGTVNLNQWYPHGFTRASGGAAKLWWDGAILQSGTSGNFVDNTGDLNLGVFGDIDETFLAYQGSVAELAIWTTNLTDSEMISLAKGTPAIMVRPQNLIGYWPLRGLQGGNEQAMKYNSWSNPTFAQVGSVAATSHPPIRMKMV